MKKLLVLLWVLLIPISYMAGNTYAWFSDSVTANAVIASGNISIEQHEVFKQGQEIAPAIPNGGDITQWKNYVQKEVTVENKGSLPAYVRTFVAIPTGGIESNAPSDPNWIHWNINTADWSWVKDSNTPWDMLNDVMINGVEYDIYIATRTTPLIAPVGETTKSVTSPSLLGFYIDSSVSNDDSGRYYFKNGSDKIYFDLPFNKDGETDVKVLVATQATQSNVFDNAYTALNTVFGTPATDNHPWASEPPTNP